MLLICMSVAGTIPLIICGVMWLITGKRFPFRLGKKLVLASLFFYMVPVQMIKYYLPLSWVEHMQFGRFRLLFLGYQEMISMEHNDVAIWIPKWLCIVEAIWGFLVIGFSIYQLVKYLFQIRLLKRYSKEETLNILGIKANNTVRVSNLVKSPYTVGFLNAFIVIPESMKDIEITDLLYKHEYSHLKNKDTIVKLFCLLVICLHWFNPIAILTIVFFNRICEFVADEDATGTQSDERKKEYLRFLIEVSSEHGEMSVIWKNNILSGKDMLKRRMEYIMRRDRKGISGRMATVATLLVTALLSTSTVLAYTPSQTSLGLEENLFLKSDYATFKFSDDYLEGYEGEEGVFIADDGTTYTVPNADASPNAIFCSHVYKDGIFEMHVSDKSGSGCTIYGYNAKICLKCNGLVVNDLRYTTHYVKCTHQDIFN